MLLISVEMKHLTVAGGDGLGGGMGEVVKEMPENNKCCGYDCKCYQNFPLACFRDIL